jgi:hypothetical protein
MRTHLANTLNYQQILAALRLQREQIEEAILVIERLARGQAAEPANLASLPTAKRRGRPPAAAKKRTISEEGRRRIAEATRRRWAKKRAEQAAAAKKSGGKKSAGTAKKAS